MICPTCHGALQAHRPCVDCNGSGVVYCCEHYDDLLNHEINMNRDRELHRLLENRDALFRHPTLENAMKWWAKNIPEEPKDNLVPLAVVHKARLQWLDATDTMLAESKAWLLEHGYKTDMRGAEPLTPERRDAQRAALGKPPVLDLN